MAQRAPTRKNLFGLGRKPAPAPRHKGGSALTIPAATSQAREAGYRGRYTFSDWLEAKRLDGRGKLVIDRLGDAYRSGQERREKDDQSKIDRAEAKREASRQKTEKRAEKSYASVPSEQAIQEGFKRGKTLNEILAGNPALRAWRKANPAKFDRCVKAVQKRGGAANAYAVCSAAGTRNPSARVAKTPYGGYVVRWSEGGKKRESQDVFRTRQEAESEALHIERTRKGRKNPASAAAEVFEEFHGYAPSEVIVVTKKIHYHKHLAAAGKLESLDVWGVDDQGHRISGFKGALLAFNETKNQLFVEGGDQSIDLEDFGIDSPHELETLGRLTDIGYQTNKTHLGDEGGEAVYVHKFRTTNDAGKHVVVKIARYPDLIYDVRNEQLLFSGGSYEILREGINK